MARPASLAWLSLRPSDALRARVKAYVPASPHFRPHYEKWRVRTQARTDWHVMLYLSHAARWMDEAKLPNWDPEDEDELRDDVWFNAACVVMFQAERGYTLRDIELHLIDWNKSDQPPDARNSDRDAYLGGMHYLRVQLRVFVSETLDVMTHSTVLGSMYDVEDIDVDFLCRALRRNRVRLTMITNPGAQREVWISEPTEDEENKSRVVVRNLEFYDDEPPTEEEAYEEGDADVQGGILNVTHYGTVDLRSDGPNGWIVDDLIAGTKRADVAAVIEQSAPTAPSLNMDVAELVAEFGVLDIRDEAVFPRPPEPLRDTRKRAI